MSWATDRRIILLRNPGFSCYLLVCFLSTSASGLAYILSNWLMITVSDNVSSVLIMMICFWLPNALIGPFWGVVVDRVSRKKLLAWSNAGRALIVISFAIYFYFARLSTEALDILMLFSGAMFGLILPASVAMVRELVAREDLLYANSSIDIVYEVGNVVGMGSAGFLLSAVSPSTAYFITGGMFVLAAFMMLAVRVQSFGSRVIKEKVRAATDFALGVQYILQHRNLMMVYFVQLFILTAFMLTPVLIAPFAKNILHADSMQFSIIEAGLSVGVIIGGILLPWLVKTLGFARALFSLTSLMVGFFVIFVFNHWLTLSIILYFAIGFVLASWPLIVTKAQELTDFRFQGRVQSVFSSISSFLVLMTYLVVAVFSHVMPLSMLYFFPAALACMAAILVWRIRGVLGE